MSTMLTDPRAMLITLIADLCCLPKFHGTTIVANLAVVQHFHEAMPSEESMGTEMLESVLPYSIIANLLLISSSMLALSNLMDTDCERTLYCALMMHRYWLPDVLDDGYIEQRHAHGRFIRSLD